MRASSVGQEVEVELTREELENLPEGKLVGTLVYNEVNSRERRDMLFSLKYNIVQSSPVSERHSPKGYFGDAAQVDITINGYVFDCLMERGSGGGRFQNNSAGKIEIKVIEPSEEA